MNFMTLYEYCDDAQLVKLKKSKTVTTQLGRNISWLALNKINPLQNSKTCLQGNSHFTDNVLELFKLKSFAIFVFT